MTQQIQPQDNKPKIGRKYEVVILDTINQIQNDQYMSMLDKKTMVTHDKWKDFGVDVMMLLDHCKDLECEVVLVLGYEGSGKSFGIKYLNPETTLWMHADNKPITFKGGKRAYTKEKKNFTVPKTYERVKQMITMANSNRVDETQPLIVFITGHIEDFKSKDGEMRQRLKVLGNFATKMNLEGSVSNCFYTEVDVLGEKTEYKFRLHNNGSDTCRAMEGLFEGNYIDNNFQLIVDALKNY